MVQRYELELYHCNGGEMEPCDEGGYVEYEDYENLHAVLFLLIDQVNPSELPDSLCEKLEAMGLL